MSIRLALGLFVLAAPAAAAPLCHDLRGLYTPCTPGQATPPRRHAERAEKARAVSASAATAAEVVAPPVAPLRKKPALFDRAKTHCHDTKGLYTPCPR